MTTGNDTGARADRKYLEQLANHLQRLDVPGTRIGEILAEAEVHGAATGEPLHEAFGDPAEYARQWSPAHRRPRWLVLPYAVATGAGGFALASGTIAVMEGRTSLGLPAVLVALLGGLLLVGTMMIVPVNRIRDPRTGTLRGPGRVVLILSMLAFWVLAVVITLVVPLVG